MYIQAEHITVDFARHNPSAHADTFRALDDVDFGVHRGEFVCLLGFSGCGKSTLLNVLAGFQSPTAGSVRIDGEAVTGPSPRYVTIFQNYGLLPWKNVLKNTELGLAQRNMDAAEREAVARKYLRLVGLEHLAERFPSQLSGGQQQRVAIARGLAVGPDVLFMDEPFGALDPIIRHKLQDDLLAIVRQERKTVVFVTHDIDEAVYLADRICIMRASPGRIEETIDVRLPHPRRRNDAAFEHYRQQVYNKLFSIAENQVEYII